MNKLDNMHAWEIFISLVDIGNFELTADAFEVETSTILRAIEGLEKALGKNLVLRKHRPVELTEAGKLAYPLIKRHVTEHKQILDTLLSDSSQMTGTIRLSLAQGLSMYYGVDLVMGFKKHYPRIDFKLVGEGIIADIENGIADVACITGETKSPGIELLPRSYVDYIPIASMKYVKKKGPPVTPCDLKNHTVIRYVGKNRQSFMKLYSGDKEAIVEAKNYVKSTDILTVKNSVVKGYGVCIDMPLPLCREELKDGTLIPILPGWRAKSQPTFVAIPENLLNLRRFRIFAYWLRDRLIEIEKTE